ncbi:MAG: DUF1573 domain-containing protein [Crocinitomicaceae bacterium]|jgi:hypothetical protein|nr:DUF1573 domain-containing protein [Crocinitomicaceae bacterium]MCF8434796.1 DUF1573 domain-containing protein [Crocinitomicaceae bacterium]MDP4684183.1 DUF1573 domain-containing protein [Crocinitomicaceae bacterium]MDP4866430.1 DUF1573 domain-containing protein [Crocinitomicaceae bacterium]MDP5009861.1 DUF1573 domain-containing protein [Crocinitomicaceae bacterium]
MRLLFAIIILALNSALGFGQVAEFSLKQSVHKFPSTNEGKVLEHEFVFTNTGTIPLIFDGYSVACTCTKLILPETPIQPGKQGVIKLTFDTEGKSFYQDRIIYLKTNTKKKTEKLRIKVYVEPKPIK